MDSLYLLQFGCFIFMVINAAYLLLGSLHTRWQNKRYEHSRNLIVIALAILAFQYYLQMSLGLRAADDTYGALLNVLVYPICFSLISIGIYHVEATHSRRRQMNMVCLGFYIAICLVCGIGYLQKGSSHIGGWLYLVQVIFLANEVYNVAMITIETKLDAWRAEKGYKDTAINLLMLSRQLEVPKSDLSLYFDQCIEASFRIWLSDIRFEAAKKMMRDNPGYSNDVISQECGFSSRSQLYRIFSSKVGCSPQIWRNKR